MTKMGFSDAQFRHPGAFPGSPLTADTVFMCIEEIFHLLCCEIEGVTVLWQCCKAAAAGGATTSQQFG